MVIWINDYSKRYLNFILECLLLLPCLQWVINLSALLLFRFWFKNKKHFQSLFFIYYHSSHTSVHNQATKSNVYDWIKCVKFFTALRMHFNEIYSVWAVSVRGQICDQKQFVVEDFQQKPGN